MMLSHPSLASYPGTMVAQAHHSMIPTAPHGAQVTTELTSPVDRNTPDYLAQLLNDKKLLQVFPNVFQHMEKILDEEINRVRGNLFHLSTNKEPLCLPEESGSIVSLSEKLVVPVRDYPDFNFVGRILGPRGMTAKLLEQDTGCKIMVRGKGSMRDRAKEELNRGKANWEHLNEDLHVLITVEDTQKRAEMKLRRAVEEVKKLLVPAPEGEDDLKKLQLMELAIMNGTYRDGSLAMPTISMVTPSPQGARMMASPIGLPQVLRAPLTAGAPIFLAPGSRLHQLPQFTAVSSANGMQQMGGINQAPPLVSAASNGFMYQFDPYGNVQPVFEYSQAYDNSTAAGSVHKMRRTVIAREHPYTRSPLV